MKKNIYIFSSGELKRELNTIVLKEEEQKKAIPVEVIDSIYVFGELRFNKKLLDFLSQKNIPLHIFNYYGYYSGTYYPREYMNSGYMVLKQAEYFLNKERRLFLAKAFVYGSILNMLYNLRIYKSRGKEIVSIIKDLKNQSARISEVDGIPELMAVEGNAREIYYTSFDFIVKNEDFSFEKRKKRPPGNRMNALISFGNSLLYVTVLSEIYRTNLDPRIGYLHQTNQRSFTLNLDIAEIFKPLIVDRLIFQLINKGEIRKRDFLEELGGVFLKERGKKVFIEAYEKRLKTTFLHKKLKRKVSYRRLIRLECYKLYRHFLGDELYKPYIRTR